MTPPSERFDERSPKVDSRGAGGARRPRHPGLANGGPNRLANGAVMPASFFRIKKAGRPTLGIGSALDEKYLFRIEEWSKDADDDQILEAKVVRPLS